MRPPIYQTSWVIPDFPSVFVFAQMWFTLLAVSFPSSDIVIILQKEMMRRSLLRSRMAREVA